MFNIERKLVKKDTELPPPPPLLGIIYLEEFLSGALLLGTNPILALIIRTASTTLYMF